MNRGSEAIDDVAFFHANYSAITTGHPKVSDESGAFVQNAFVRSLNVSVRAIDSRNSSVQKPAHSDLFGSRFRVHIDDANLYPGRDLFQQFTNDAKRIVGRLHKDASEQVHHGDAYPLRFTHPNPLAWRKRRIISRTKQPRLLLDVFDHFMLVEDMIARRHYIDPGRKKQIGNRGRYGKAAGHVFGVHDGEIDFVLLFQVLQPIEQSGAARFADNITD